MGIDLGTTKVSAVIAELSQKQDPSVTGVGTTRCEALRKGVVTDIDQAASAVESAVAEAEMMAGYSVSTAFVSISGDHIKGVDSTGVVAVSRPEKEITQDDVEHVISASQAIIIPNDRLILHVIPQEFVVDDQDGIKQPVGMSGIRLEVHSHIVTCSATWAQNVIKAVRKAGIDVTELVLQPLATGYAVISKEEAELGVAVVDIGGGTTDISIFKEGTMHYASVIGLGGNNITNDIAVGLRTPTARAEAIKIQFGCSRAAMADESLIFEVEGVQGRKNRRISGKLLAQIIEPRIEEILYLVRKELVRSEYYEVLGAGLVLTGGTSLLNGIADFAEEVISIPARVGVPERIGGLVDYVSDPKMATGVGLIHYANQVFMKGGVARLSRGGRITELVGKVKRWVNTFF